MDIKKSERLTVPKTLGHRPRGTQPRERGAGGSESQGGNGPQTQSCISTSTKLLRIAQLAKERPDIAFTNLAHHIDIDFMHEAFRRTRKDGATGVDGQTAEEYAQNLEGNLESLLNRFKSGSYFAPPVRGTEIPKAPGKVRVIGIPTFEDKVLQRAVAMTIEAIYEQEFVDDSYGFRPGRGAHDALEELWREAMDMGRDCWVLEADIKSFFDTLDHEQLRAFLDRRVRDGVIRRTINKWLKAGMLKDGAIQARTEGTPQGGVISPLLANIYLHEVLDIWFERTVKPRMAGRVRLIRYADDFVILFTSERDARLVMEVLPKRFGRFGLTLHPEKTKLIDFRRPSGDRSRDPERPQAGATFDLLGFTHYWGRTRKGSWAVTRRTMRTRQTRGLRSVWEWCKQHRHQGVPEQRRALNAKLQGHYQYYGITGNYRALDLFFEAVTRFWRYWLNRRNRQREMPWPKFAKLLERYPLSPPRVARSALRRAANPNL